MTNLSSKYKILYTKSDKKENRNIQVQKGKNLYAQVKLLRIMLTILREVINHL